MLAIEFLVLVLIAYEVLYLSIWQRLKMRRRSRVVLDLMRQGQTLQEAMPDSPEGLMPWKSSVTAWVTETDAQLAKYSPEAVVVFRHNPTPVQPGGTASSVRLSNHLNNLRRILENPDVYL